ncbi:hypothetical protein [Streptomyces bacillaris]|uniref:hypothetical protein n=1 Tax=Streptomyces bacillaris TaxID=68179 RepID=UPI0036328C89
MTQWEWSGWTALWAGEDDEDLSLVLREVRKQRTAKTQQAWARDPLTRGFCDLGAYSLYQHHLSGGIPFTGVPEMTLFPNMGAEHLMKLAATVVPDTWLAGGLNRQRYVDTWAHHHSYITDLITYIFRSAPTLRRVQSMTGEFVQAASDLSFGELIRVAAQAEIESALNDPILSLQALLQAALPRQPKIQAAVRKIEQEMLTEWTTLYEKVLTGYGLSLRPGVTARDMAELFDTMIEGVLLRARSGGSIPVVSTGQDIFTASLLVMLPALCDVPLAELERRKLQHPLR